MVCGGKPRLIGAQAYLNLAKMVSNALHRSPILHFALLYFTGVNHGISQDGLVAILTVRRSPPPRYPVWLDYFNLQSYRIYSTLTVFLVDLIHVYFLALVDI